MCVRLKYNDTPLGRYVAVRIGKQLNISITHESSNMAKPDQFLTLFFVDIGVKYFSTSYTLTASIFSFPQMPLEYYFIDYFLTAVRSWRTPKFKRRIERFQKLTDLVLSKNSEISTDLIKELVDCGTNVIDPYKPVEVHPLIGQSGNIYNITSFNSTVIERNIEFQPDSYGCGRLIAPLIEILNMNDLQLMDECGIHFEEKNIDESLDDLRKHIRNVMTLCFQLIAQSPYFDKLRIRYTNHP